MKGAVEQRPAAAGGQLVLEGSAAVCLRTVWHQPVPQQLPELASPAGVCLQAPQEAAAQGGRSQTGGLRGEYAALWEEAQRTEARIFFADEAHFRADAELRGKWVLRGEPAPVESTSPQYGEKASYYSAMCLETGEVEWIELEGNSNSGTSVAFLKQLRGKHPGPLRVIWDNAPAHRGEAVREYLRTPELELRLVNPRLHEGRLCRATARTSTPMRRSGVGRERRRRGTCAWEARSRCRRGSATSWPGWSAGRTR